MKGCNTAILIIILVIVGLGLGLLVGWILWPVQWTDASPAEMRIEFQVDWLEMSAQSYAVNQNAALAAERYSYLGEDGPAVLAIVEQAPSWVTEEEVQAYAQAVTGESGTAAVEVTPAEDASTIFSRLLKPPLFAYAAVALFLALLAIVLLVVLVIRLLSGRGEKAVTEPELQPAAEELAEQAGVTPVSQQPTDTALEEVAAVEVVSEAEQATRTGEVADLGAGAVVTAAAGAAIVAGLKDEEAPEEQAAGEAEAVVSAVEEVSSDEGAFEGVAASVRDAVEEPAEDAGGGLGGVLAAGAVAAGVGWALESDEETGTAVEAGEPTPITDEALVAGTTAEWMPEVEPAKESADFYGKYNRKVVEVEGIGEVYAKHLNEVGISTTHALLQQCATPKGREELAEKTGISGKLILEWANHADMMRIQGIGPQWSDLLEAAGVDTVREMAMRNPTNLHQRMLDINNEKKLVRKLPTLEQIEDWIEQAKDLPRILTY